VPDQLLHSEMFPELWITYAHSHIVSSELVDNKPMQKTKQRKPEQTSQNTHLNHEQTWKPWKSNCHHAALFIPSHSNTATQTSQVKATKDRGMFSELKQNQAS
jgi:hypothetical protein